MVGLGMYRFVKARQAWSVWFWLVADELVLVRQARRGAVSNGMSGCVS
jgi:hypothetical protein